MDAFEYIYMEENKAQMKFNNTQKGNTIKKRYNTKTMYKMYYRIPKDIKKVVWKLRKQFNRNEFMLLDYILSNCIAWHRVCHWYDVDEILDDLDMSISSFKKAKLTLIKYNIINVCKISKEEKRELRFKTSKVVVFNVYYKNWTIYNPDIINELISKVDGQLNESNKPILNDEQLMEELDNL